MYEMVIQIIKIWVIWNSHAFWVFVYLSKSAGYYKLTNEQKTKNVGEIQITQVFYN